MMSNLADKCQKDTGNKIMLVVNRKLWLDVLKVLGNYLADFKTDGTYMYSMAKNGGEGGYVKVGATYNTYEYAGNQISFAVDRSLTRWYPDKGYGVAIDLTADITDGKPAIAKYSIAGKECMTNTVAGVGGLDGKTSGPVASNVAGSMMVMHGYAGVVVYSPYRSAILREV